MDPAVMASHKPKQEQERDFLPQCFATGKVNARTTTMRAVNQGDLAHGVSISSRPESFLHFQLEREYLLISGHSLRQLAKVEAAKR
jgi:hypothetical protein